ncbi:MAG: VCBS repeat-containing protein [Pseudomonadota bacterium]
MRPLIMTLATVAGIGAAKAEPVTPTFRDMSAALPVSHVYDGGWEHFVGGGVAVFDCNADQLPDAFVAGGTNPARLLINRSAIGGRLDFQLSNGALKLTGVTGAYPINIDGDTHIDLVVLRVGENILLRGLGKCTFARANEAWQFDGGDSWSTSFTATWETGAQWPTLFIGNYVDRTDPEGPFEACDANELHRPQGQGFAQPVRLEPGFCALSALISDELRKGRRDLRISNDRHYYVRGGSEQKLRLDTLEFLGEADGWPTVSLWGMGIAAQDITGDGRAEVMSTSMGDQLMQIATDEGYENAPFSMGTYAQKPFFGDDGRPSTGWHAQFGDVNNDGRPDLFIAKGNVDQMPSNAIKDPNTLLLQTETGSFVETALAAGVATTDRSRGAALVDFNADGRLDLMVVNRRAPLELYQNDSPVSGNWLKLDLSGDAANVHAIGAIIEARTIKGTHTREVTIGGGHAGGQLGAHHFGVGDAESVALRVIAPDGTPALDWTELPVNTRCTLSLANAVYECAMPGAG